MFRVGYNRNSWDSPKRKKTEFTVDIFRKEGCVLDLRNPLLTLRGYYFKSKILAKNLAYSWSIDKLSDTVYPTDRGIILIDDYILPRELKEVQLKSVNAINKFAGIEGVQPKEVVIGDLYSFTYTLKSVLAFLSSEDFINTSLFEVSAIYFLVEADSEDYTLLSLDSHVKMIGRPVEAPNGLSFQTFRLECHTV